MGIMDETNLMIERAEQNWISACATHGEDHPITQAYLADLRDWEHAKEIFKDWEE